MIVGFTGTQRGMTELQRQGVENILEDWNTSTGVEEAHHGDCIGADDQFDLMCFKRNIYRHMHLCTIESKQAGCFWMKDRRGRATLIAAKPPLERNQDIVDVSDILIAAPAGFSEEQRSGTWATIRRARKRGIKIIIVWPDGKTYIELRRNSTKPRICARGSQVPSCSAADDGSVCSVCHIAGVRRKDQQGH